MSSEITNPIDNMSKKRYDILYTLFWNGNNEFNFYSCYYYDSSSM